MTNRSELTQSLDELVVQIANYPVLLVCLLFNPKRVFQSSWGQDSCPAGITLGVTLSIAYTVVRFIYPQIFVEETEWASMEFMLMLSLLYIALMIQVQRFLIRLVDKNRLNNVPVQNQIKWLVYPFCLYLLAALIPGVLLSEEVWANPSAGMVFIPADLIFIWALFNVVHYGFEMPVWRALAAAFLANLGLITLFSLQAIYVFPEPV